MKYFSGTVGEFGEQREDSLSCEEVGKEQEHGGSQSLAL